MSMLRLHDTLVGRAVLGGVLAVWSVILGLDLVFALMADFDRIGQGDYGATTALLALLLTLPRRLYDLFPYAAVIGALLGLGALSASSELTALRAAGLSRQRIAGSALAVLLLLTVVMVVSAETIGPGGEREARALTTRAVSRNLIAAQWSGIWAREGDTFINARQGTLSADGMTRRVELGDLRLYEFSPEGRLLSLAHAQRAIHEAGVWTLFEVRRTLLGKNSAVAELHDQERWASDLDGDSLAASVAHPRYLPTAEIRHSIDTMHRNGLNARPFEEAFWARIFFPLNVLALCLAAMPFAFGQLRSGGLGKRVFSGIVFGLGYFMLDRFAVNLANAYTIDMALVRVVPPSLLLLGAWVFGRRH